MIQIVILIFIGRWLYLLAKKFKKPNAWLYGLFAILTYFGTSFIFGVIVVLIMLAAGSDLFFTTGEELILSLIGIPVGIGGVALLHYLLKRKWSKDPPAEESLLDEAIDQLDKEL